MILVLAVYVVAFVYLLCGWHFQLEQLNDPLFEKEIFIRFSVSVFRALISISAF